MTTPLGLDPSLLLRAAGFVVFAAVAASDLRTRKAPNEAWATLLFIGGLALLTDGFLLPEVIGLGIVVTFVSAVALVAFRHRAIGGADAKALMVLPIVFPRLPTREMWNGVFGALLQGLEVVVVVSVAAGLVGLAWQLGRARLDVDDGKEVPFLVPIFVSVAVLWIA